MWDGRWLHGQLWETLAQVGKWQEQLNSPIGPFEAEGGGRPLWSGGQPTILGTQDRRQQMIEAMEEGRQSCSGPEAGCRGWAGRRTRGRCIWPEAQGS